MKLLQDSCDAKSKSKILKPQVERRRRERMNRSLDSLKTLLFQRQVEPQRRVEKAEILEHTVLFLQNSAKDEESRAGGQQHSFQDGFSSCLQRAALFLGPEGKGLWLHGALDASFSARFASSDSAGEQKKTDAFSSSLLPRRSSRALLTMLKHRSGSRLRAPALNLASCAQSPEECSRSHTGPPQPHRATSRGSKHGRSHVQPPVGQALWRPWP